MIFILSRLNANGGYDEYYAKAVVAKHESEARILANGDVGDEGTIWTDPMKTKCEIVDPDGASGVFCSDFHAG